jgi:hypothetical protein
MTRLSVVVGGVEAVFTPADIARWREMAADDAADAPCGTCDGAGFVDAAVASWMLPVPCPDCPAADDLAWDAAEERGHR